MATRWQIMLALLLLAILSCAAQSTEDENNKRMRDLSNKENVGGLAGWAQMGRGILNIALRGYPTAAFGQDSTNGDLTFDFKALAMWMIGPFVLLAICLLFAFITLCCVCPCFYCCRSCGNCGGSEPKPGGYTRGEVIKAMVVLAIGVALVLIGFIIGLVSNSLVDQGVSDMEFSVTETIDDVLALPNQFQTTFGSIVTNINGTVEDIIDLIRAVPSSIVGSDGDLTYLVHNTTRYLREIQGVFDILLLKGTEINGSVHNIIHTYEVLKPKTDAINERVLALASPQEYQNSGEYYAVNMTCLGLDNFVPIIVLNVTGLFPDFLSLLDDISGINLNDTADSVDDQFASITANVTDMIDTQFANVRSQVNSFVDQAQSVIDDQLNGTFSSVLDQIKSVQSTIQAGVDQYVTPNNRWRFIIMAVLFAFNGLAALICLVGFFFKISPVMTCSSVISFFLVFLFWILCALHLIVAAPTGKLCDIYYKREILEAIPPGLLDGVFGTGSNRKRDFFDFSNLTIMQPHSAEFYVDLFYDGLDTCHDGGNLIEFLNLTDALQLRQFVDDFLNSTDLNSLVDQVNISSFVGNVDFTSGLNLTQVTGYLAYLNEDYVVYVNILEGIAFKPVVQAITNNTLLLDTFKDNTTLIASCLSSGSNVSDPNAAANDISTELNSIYTTMLSINASDVHDIGTNITTLRNQLISFSVFANSTVNLTMEVITFVEGIANQLITIGNKFVFTVTNHTIPVGVNMVLQLADEIEASVIGFANCTWVADDVLGIINSFCVSTVGGLDTVWITCGYLGLVLFIMIAGITLVAKRKIRSDALDQEHPMDDDFYDNRNNMELPPIYSEATEKA